MPFQTICLEKIPRAIVVIKAGKLPETIQRT